ncbi:MAG: AAA family ATPase [Proteobacteria bacterium]|nr:AAA family ATPase [Pseudomonadota bacterium]
MARFIGRQRELAHLLETTRKSSASFVVVRGRRRVGKSRLIEEFSRHFDHYCVFTGLAPDKNTTAADQLKEFSRQIARQFKIARALYEDWSDAFWAVAERVQSGQVLLFFDEISWMGSKDPTFLAKIKDVWDRRLKHNDRLVFVVCGSASSWIEENLLSSTAFVGRISYTLTLEPLPLVDCDRFWPDIISAYEKFKVLSVTGGVPKYLEEIDPRQPAEDNIKRLCFTRGGSLVEEFDLIFSDLFLRDSDDYRLILEALCAGAKEVGEIADFLQRGTAGRIPEYLRELELAGFVARDFTWNLRTGEDGKLSRFRLRDNYLRFYLKYIQKNRHKIERDSFALKSLGSLPEWSAMMGLQFENLVLNSRGQLHELLRIDPQDIINENPFYQRKTRRHAGCQIDYLVQTRFGSLYVCEIRFSKDPVGSTVLTEMKTKLAALGRPRGISYRPVLIHVNGVTTDVMDSNYFAAIVDAQELLQAKSQTSMF